MEQKTSKGQGFSLAAIAFIVSLWWTLIYSYRFFGDIWQTYPQDASPWAFMGTMVGVLVLLNLAFLVVLSLLPRWLFKLLVIVLSLVGSVAFVSSLYYGVTITPSMMRSVLATDVHEASAYASLQSLLMLVLAWLPPVGAVLFLGPKRACRFKPLTHGVLKGLAALVMVAAALGLVSTQYQTFIGMNRDNHNMRYAITPYNVLYGAVKTSVHDQSPDAVRERTVIDPEPKLTIHPSRPTVFVVVVGETARAQNWGLNGYEPTTTPLLAKESGVINFRQATSCGTSTDESVPCMMSRVGRFNYNRDQILKEESLPALLARAGVNVLWVDNQAGCKGTCQGVKEITPDKDPQWCRTEYCDDQVMWKNVDEALAAATPEKPTVLFLHQIGSHGPKYWERSREAIKRFKPECHEPSFAGCSQEEIVNAYNNSLVNTDEFLAGIIDRFKAHPDVDTALWYMSDHGESLGEKGVYLHGAPYFLAPAEQTRIPMVMWFSPTYVEDYHVPVDVIEARQDTPVSHDNLFSTMLGLLGIHSSVHDSRMDLTVPYKP